ncbi:AAA family ATPase [Synechococcus sp. R55.3]|jgi:ATP-dependent 26S proteasome regulatory subunit|uniref:AAA family ATPase n=1 Tax=unclassified Synechococcus TaxID=2626047 RepID=UPI0039C3E502
MSPSDLAFASNHQDILTLLDLVVRARYPLIYLVTPEEAPAEELLQVLADSLKPKRKLLIWDIVSGWSDNGQNKGQLMPALGRIGAIKEDEAVICVLKDLNPTLRNPERSDNYPVIRYLKTLARESRHSRKSIILLGQEAVVPAELREEIVVYDFPLPSIAEIERIITRAIPARQLELSGPAREQLVRACQGLTRQRIERILARALAAKGKVSEGDIDLVLEEKKQYIRQTEILEFYNPSETLQNVGGLENLKAWIRQRRNSFSAQARAYGLPSPKGILLAGIQGTGKSLCAKTIAREWRMPLLRLDVGRLFGGIVGESESRVRQMIQIAEAMAPCVLWIDELDKAFGGVNSEFSGDSGTSKRVFGSLITWMQEKTKPVFIVATANNVRILPAELLRKGRFDEIFFVNLPNQREREEIFQVHIQRLRPNRVRDFAYPELAMASENFSGAEIEQTIYDAMHMAFNQDPPREFTQEDILGAIRQTVPLAAIARDQIQDLKAWAAESGARTASQDQKLIQELRTIVQKRGLGYIEVDSPPSFSSPPPA